MFQSRGVEDIYDLPVEDQLPDDLYALGEPSQVRYYSNKDDPDTRDERIQYGVEEDPDGVQGVWKEFYHDHDLNEGLRLYTRAEDLRTYDRSFNPALLGGQGSAADVSWPASVWWLAFFDNVTWKGPDGREHKFAPPARTWGLWGFPSTRSLVAWPMSPSRRASRFLVWSGGNLCVTKFGIQG